MLTRIQILEGGRVPAKRGPKIGRLKGRKEEDYKNGTQKIVEQLTEGSRARQERRRGEQERGQEKRRKKRTNDTVIVKRRCVNFVSSEAF